MRIVLEVAHCGQCPRGEKRDKGHGVYSVRCELLGRETMPYIEYPSELRQPPDDCPLQVNTINIMQESISDDKDGTPST